jgi:RNA polymerase sigma-70 factor
MESPLEVTIQSLADPAYRAAFACHGDLGLGPNRYAGRLLSVTTKYLGANPTQGTTVTFVNGLHTGDLYLSVACAKRTNLAWDRFALLYEAFIGKVARTASLTNEAAQTLAEGIAGHLFLPDASGCSRIGSYEGRSSLAAWLSAVINNAAMKEQSLSNRFDQLESTHDVTDPAGLRRSIDAVLRTSSYASLVLDSLAVAGESLTDQERLILVLRYEDGLQGNEIAVILGVHPATVTRRLRHVCCKLRGKTLSTLESRHQLSQIEIKECVDEIRDNPDYSILTLLKTGT